MEALTLAQSIRERRVMASSTKKKGKSGRKSPRTGTGGVSRMVGLFTRGLRP